MKTLGRREETTKSPINKHKKCDIVHYIFDNYDNIHIEVKFRENRKKRKKTLLTLS